MSDLIKKLNKFKLPLQLALMVVIIFSFGNYIPSYFKQICLSISLSLKHILYFILPLIIFGFLFNSLVSMKNGVLKFVIMLFTLVYSSNFLAILTACVVNGNILPYMNINAGLMENVNKLEPLWQLELPKLVSNETALMIGLLTGIFFSIKPNEKAILFARKFNILTNKFLRKFFIPILPLFIAGFIFKMQHEGMLGNLFKIYGSIIVLVLCTQISYLSLYYLLASNFKFNRWLKYIKNVFPAGLTGFSTMSSAAALPLSIIAAEQNLKDKDMAEAIVPATVNIHTVGSAIGLTTMALATVITYKMPMPILATFLKFTAYYAIAKFAVAGIPGGAVFVATPLFESFFGFTDEMSGLITALYMFLDPFSTSANVLGNGAFAILFTKIFKNVNKAPKMQVNEV